MNAREWFYTRPGFHYRFGEVVPDRAPAAETVPAVPVVIDDDKTLLLICCKALLRDLREAFDAAGNPFSDPVHGEVRSMRAAAALIARLEAR